MTQHKAVNTMKKGVWKSKITPRWVPKDQAIEIIPRSAMQGILYLARRFLSWLARGRVSVKKKGRKGSETGECRGLL